MRPMNQEQPIQFNSGGNKLFGILHSVEKPRDKGVIFLSGWSGCRLGPHRMFVKIARELAQAGFQCLRFDFAGRGESEGNSKATGISSMTSDAGCAIDFMQNRIGCNEYILIGICSGGKVAISRAAIDERVKGLVLWSAEPMGYLAGGMREARKSVSMFREYLRKLLYLQTWRKFFTGRVNFGMVKNAVVGTEHASDEERREESKLLKKFSSFRGKVQFVYGTRDPETGQASAGYENLCRESGISFESHRIEGANHSFYSLDWEKQVIAITTRWLDLFT